ncbi:MAG TPA: hypothetical protein VLA59_09950 [Patescibacteria group bacterium]|nr:hypothetical protein [Patescibacteria group bacterium]
MSDRDNPGGGGLTGATGDLTPEAPDQAFEPGERREVAGPDRAQVTYRQGSTAPAQQGDVGTPGDASIEGPTNLAERESGYGSEHGLSPEDPAYRMDVHPPAGSEDAAPERTHMGGDERTDHEERY